MGKYAIILNGSMDSDTLSSVQSSVHELRKMDYNVYVGNPVAPTEKVDGFVKVDSLYNYYQIISDIKKKMNNEDELLIFATGHGCIDESGPALSYGKSCYSNEPIPTLRSIPCRIRTVVTEPCFSGEWTSYFKDGPPTLFVSAGSRSELTAGGGFGNSFWETPSKIKERNGDQDGDGNISIFERAAYAESNTYTSIASIKTLSGADEYFVPSVFPKDVDIIENNIDYTNAVLNLHNYPGHYLIMLLYDQKLDTDKNVLKKFIKQAIDSSGRHAFAVTINPTIKKTFHSDQSQTVVAISWRGEVIVVPDQKNIMQFISEYSPDTSIFPLEQAMSLDPFVRAESITRMFFHARKNYIRSRSEIADVYVSGIQIMFKDQNALIQEMAMDIYEKLIPYFSDKKLEDGINDLVYLLINEGNANVRKKALAIFEKAINRVDDDFAMKIASLLRKKFDVSFINLFEDVVFNDGSMSHTVERAILAYNMLIPKLPKKEILNCEKDLKILRFLGPPIVRTATIDALEMIQLKFNS